MNLDDFLTDQQFDDSVKQNTGPVGGAGGVLGFLGVFAFIWSLIQLIARFFIGL